MNKLDIVTEFCSTQSDELFSAGTRKRKSLLLQIQDDIDYNLGMYKSFKSLGLTPLQHKLIDTELAPLFVVPLLYCSAIDLISRVQIKHSHPSNNSRAFRKSAELFFNFNQTETSVLWKFRNSLSHQYSIRHYIISRYGNEKVIDVHSDRIVIAVRPMRSSLITATNNLYEFLQKESPDDKGKTSAFLKKHGFSYYLI